MEREALERELDVVRKAKGHLEEELQQLRTQFDEITSLSKKRENQLNELASRMSINADANAAVDNDALAQIDAAEDVNSSGPAGKEQFRSEQKDDCPPTTATGTPLSNIAREAVHNP